MNEPEPERGFVACMPFSGGSEVPPVPSEVVACGTCGSRVWISVTIYPRVLTDELVPVCLLCLPQVAEAAGNELEARIHPDQEKELAEAGVLDYAQSLVERWNALIEATDERQ